MFDEEEEKKSHSGQTFITQATFKGHTRNRIIMKPKIKQKKKRKKVKCG